MREGRSAPSVEEGIALSHPSSLKPERERKNIETCMRDKASKSGKVFFLSEMCVQSGRFARGGRFPGGPRCGGGLSMCRFQQFGGAREWPPTPSVS